MSTAALLALALAAGGWRQFKWGMSVAELAEAVELVGDENVHCADAPRCGNADDFHYCECTGDFMVQERTVVLNFRLRNDRLYQINVVPSGDVEDHVALDWFQRAGVELTAKYGKPAEARHADASVAAVLGHIRQPVVIWRLRDVWIRLILAAGDTRVGPYLSPYIEFSGPDKPAPVKSKL